MRSPTSLLPLAILLRLFELSSLVNAAVTVTKSYEGKACLLQDNIRIKSHKPQLDVQLTNSNRVCLSCATALDFDKHHVLDWVAYHNLHGIDCFLLFLDTEKSDLNDPLVFDVYTKLTSLSMVTVINVTQYGVGNYHRIGDVVTLSEARAILPKDVAYLGLIDTDEYLVTHGRQEASSSSTAFNQIPQLLEDSVGAQSKMGIHLNRWTYGSSGWTDPPPYETAPEFVYFVERGVLPHARGKMILNLDLAIKHNVEFGENEKWTQHVLTLKADSPQMVSANDTSLSINHYVTASLQECWLKAPVGAYKKPDRAGECSEKLNDVKDGVLVNWAEPTRTRRAMLFP